ncbi:tRNA (adenosine(37)-N6)-threonylcarbamoyltransferase complex dimerization subunit type 1 TsaB [Mycoplasma sp. 6243]|uniref:tRNA (adenosine(37)-N6)-threonylcarbamoyltransferase complex dimerization subunit type 1 TsaB n=1 Tax=Mycoplasma sp. 6243 TaxID=3440865 RepID=UPI003EBC5AB6
MYNLFLDTTGKDFCIALFDLNFNLIKSVILENYKKKIDLIVKYFNDFNIKINEINGLYINLGPGFFTGVRVGFVFFRTLALANNIDFYTTTTFELLMMQNDKDTFYTDAQGKKVYFFDKQMFLKTEDIFESTKVIDATDNITLDNINYQKVISKFLAYQHIFTKKHPLEVEPTYIKKPQIGSK